MDGKTFAKLCKDANMVDRSLTKTDVDILFAKVLQHLDSVAFCWA